MRRWTGVLLLALFAATAGSTAATHDIAGLPQEDEFPPEMCFRHIPGIDDCIEPAVGWYYLSEPQLLATQNVRIEIGQNQAIWLWGYPLTDLHLERNADGDCVFTQWFERAVFEFHEVSARYLLDWKLRRLGAELHGDALYEPEYCTIDEFFE